MYHYVSWLSSSRLKLHLKYSGFLWPDFWILRTMSIRDLKNAFNLFKQNLIKVKLKNIHHISEANFHLFANFEFVTKVGVFFVKLYDHPFNRNVLFIMKLAHYNIYDKIFSTVSGLANFLLQMTWEFQNSFVKFLLVTGIFFHMKSLLNKAKNYIFAKMPKVWPHSIKIMSCLFFFKAKI